MAKRNRPGPIMECMAYEICAKVQGGPLCDICRQLTVDRWKEHVRGVLGRATAPSQFCR
jgi:hypothetical protein